MSFGNYLRIGEAACFLGACTKTLRRWESSGKLLPAFRTAGRHRRYDRLALLSAAGASRAGAGAGRADGSKERSVVRAAIYGRVSSSRQKTRGDLERQMEALRRHCLEAGFKVVSEYRDVGSGLNDKRQGLLKMLRDAARRKFDVVVVNYSDRLARFGVRVIREHL